jgi:ribonucleases P/MRP protein subunit RPP40
MLHGKKGFERVVWAAKNVLNRSLTWLFYHLRDTEGLSLGTALIISPRCVSSNANHAGVVDPASPLSKHNPTIIDFKDIGKHDQTVRIPPLRSHDMAMGCRVSDIEDWTHDVVEWLGLVSLESARVQANDNVDPHLCRWTFPAGTSEQATPIRILRWEGIVDSGWITQLLITCM